MATRSPNFSSALRIRALLGLILIAFCTNPSQAKPQVKHPARPAAAAGAHPILEAKRAFDDRDPQALMRVRAKLVGDPLFVWADYWTQRVMLSKDPFAADGLARVQAFAQQHGAHPLVRALQRDWGLSALDKGPWVRAAEVVSEIPADLDSAGIRCARARLTGQANRESGLALVAGNEASPGCQWLLEDLASQGLLTQDDLRIRARWAAVAGELPAADRISAMTGLPPKDRAVMIEHELQRVLADARIESSRALTRFQKLEGQLSAEQRAYGQMVLGARLWARSDARAWPLTQEGLRSRKAQPDVILETAARQALRFNDLQALDALITAMPERLQNDETWLYWRGWLLSQSGKPFEAKVIWSRIPAGFGFYPQLAAEPLGRPLLPPLLSDAQRAEIARLRQSLGQSPAVKRSFMLNELGLRSESAVEWGGLLQGQSDLLILAASEVSLEAGMPDRAISAAIRTREVHSMAHRYPSPYLDAVIRLTPPGSVKPAWVMGLIRQESRFIQDIRSPVGAVGLMQLMPRTAKAVAKELGMSHLEPHRLVEPDFNLKLGVQYLKGLAADFDGSYVLATAAYNAGPSRSRIWQASLRQPISGAAFAESIPFGETRDYVKKVLSNSAAYQASLQVGPRLVGLDAGQHSLSGWLDTIGPRKAAGGSMASN